MLARFEREIKIYFSNIKLRDVTDKKTFWRKVKPLFSEKENLKQTKITLAEKGKISNEAGNPSESKTVFFRMTGRLLKHLTISL